MTEEQAFVLANPDGAVYAPGAYVLALGSLQADRPHRGGVQDRSRRRLARARRRGLRRLRAVLPPGLPGQPGAGLDPGTRWRRGQARGRREGRRRRLRPRRVDVLLAEQFPSRTLWAATTTRSRSSSRASGPPTPASADRIAFEVGERAGFRGRGLRPGRDVRLPARHGRPGRRRPHIRQSLAEDGTWLIVEPIAGDTVADNLNPVGRVYYGFSTFLCVPNALSQTGGYPLGAQAGETAIGEVVAQAGFTRFRRAAETPFNLVFEARP